MDRGLRALVGVAVCALAVSTPREARAEWFADIYVGAAFAQKSDVETHGGQLGRATFTDVSFDRSMAYGGRVGHWFEGLSVIGLGADVLFWTPDVSAQTATQRTAAGSARIKLGDTNVSMTAVSFDLMLRLPFFRSRDFAQGRLQPYALVGPTVHIADAENRSNFGIPTNNSDTDVSLGYQAGAGVAWLLTKDIGLLVEYRATHASPEFEFGHTRVSTDLDGHFVLVGLTARF